MATATIGAMTLRHILPCLFFMQFCHSLQVNKKRRWHDYSASHFPLQLSIKISPPDPPELIPETNPEADLLALSLAGVSHAQVLSGLDKRFPPKELQARNARSRVDGYWPFLQKGKDPPKDYTYGEFDFYFFASILNHARQYFDSNRAGWEDKVIVDIGSGMGRLVLAAAALHPNCRECRGVEILKALHDDAQRNVEKCLQNDGTLALDTDNGLLAMAPISFENGSLDDPYVYLGDADCIFVFSSCMSPDVFEDLAKAVGRQCRPGTIVITTDGMLPLDGFIDPVQDDARVPWGSFELMVLEKIDGYCWLTGGSSTCFIHRVVRSLWTDNQERLERPVLSKEDVAYRVAMARERGELVDTEAFLREVSNTMIFYGFPNSWIPRSTRQ